MRKFRFRLQPALDAAKARERDASVANGRAQAARNAASTAMALLDARAGEARAIGFGCGAAGEGVLAVASLRACIVADWYLERLRAVRGAGERELERACRHAEAARERLVALRSEAKALDLVRERRLAEHRVVLARREEAEFDEGNALRKAPFCGPDDDGVPDEARPLAARKDGR